MAGVHPGNVLDQAKAGKLGAGEAVVPAVQTGRANIEGESNQFGGTSRSNSITIRIVIETVSRPMSLRRTMKLCSAPSIMA